MRISRVAMLERELTLHKVRRRTRTTFPQTRCDAELLKLIKNKKKKLHITWEDAITEMGIEWLKK